MNTNQIIDTVMATQPAQINSVTTGHHITWLGSMCAAMLAAIGDLTSVFQSLAALAAVGYTCLLGFLKIRDEIRNSKKRKNTEN